MSEIKRVYFAMVPLDTTRPGGAWWYRDMPSEAVDVFVEVLAPVCTGLRVASGEEFVPASMHISPPDDARVIK
mgnify:FL=1